MIITIQSVILCIIMWILCFLGTGNDEKNFKSINSYPEKVQNIVKENEKFKGRYKAPNYIVSFLSNLVLFSILLFICGIFIRTDKFVTNFLYILILGEVMNLFDLLVVDLLWWRNVKRIRFSFLPEKEPYQNPKLHIYAFLRGALMFAVVALIDGALLILF